MRIPFPHVWFETIRTWFPNFTTNNFQPDPSLTDLNVEDWDLDIPSHLFSSFQHILNFQVCLYNYMHLNKPSLAPPRARIFRASSGSSRYCACQLAVLRRLARRNAPLYQAESFGAADLGRAAAKFENVVTVLTQLHDRAVELRVQLDPYHKPKDISPHHVFPGYNYRDTDTHGVGSIPVHSMEVARDLVASRLNFKGTPSFDPGPHLEPATKDLYENPQDYKFEVNRRRLPAEQFKLFEKLDDGHWISLIPARADHPFEDNGAFCVFKDLLRDRLILDGRRPNMCEYAINRWVQTMACIAILCGMYLHPDNVLSIYAEDLTDFYYEFLLNRNRIMRTVMKGLWDPQQFVGFKCWSAAFSTCKHVRVCFRSMAMGDHNSVEYGQNSHAGPVLVARILYLHELVYLRGRTPRGPVRGGVCIDDFVLLEEEKGHINCMGRLEPQSNQPDGSVAKVRIQALRELYDLLRLQRNQSKTVYRVFQATVWGGAIDGV